MKTSKQDAEIENLKARVVALEARNKRVETDKAWETSGTRKAAIIILTFLVVLVFLYFTDDRRPLMNAAGAALGFFLSTLVMTSLKRRWARWRHGSP